VTGSELTGHELDRLADYAAGVLDPADASQVAQLVRTHPTWSRGYQALVAADRVVSAQLRAYARGRITPMPADVVARVDLALAELAGARRGRPGSRVAAASTTDARVVPIRRARRSWAMAGAAAAVLVAVFGGIWVVTNGLVHTSMGSTAGAPQAASNRGEDSVAAPVAPGTLSGPQLLTTGTDYRADTLYLLASATADVKAGQAPTPSPRGAAIHESADQIAACTSAVNAAHPGTITKIDLARFAGAPALVVLIATMPTGTATRGAQLVVAVAPDCSSGLHELASQQVP
jgi:hypothetical protein